MMEELDHVSDQETNGKSFTSNITKGEVIESEKHTTENLNFVESEQTNSKKTICNLTNNAQFEVPITSCDEINICEQVSINHQINNDFHQTNNMIIDDVHHNFRDRQTMEDPQSTDIQRVNDEREKITVTNQQITMFHQTTNNQVLNSETQSNACDLHVAPESAKNQIEDSEESIDNRDICFANKLKRDIGSYFEPEAYKKSKVNLYAEDTGPKFYTVKCNNVTPTLIPSNLPEAFKFLPVHGRPRTKADKDDFLKNKLKEFVGGDLNEEEFEQLSKECCPDKLRTGRELMMPSSVPGSGLLPPPSPCTSQSSSKNNEELCTVKKHKLRLKMDPKNFYQKRFKYRSVRMIPVSQEEFNMDNDDSPLEPGKDLVFHVRFYRPFPYNPLEKQIKSRHSLLSCDMVLLGRQTLEDLRDRVACASDVVMRVDVSHDPDSLPSSTSKELFPSGFLFINNVFYVDGRAGCADTSLRVRDWAVKRGLGLFPHHDMARRLDQLPLKLGHPDVYVHQGSCEHLFTFSDVRLLTTSDPLNISQYPYHTSVGANQTVYCTTCAEFGAKWIVVGCSRVPFNSSFFCDTCFRMYFYKGKEKIGDFRAYAYRGNELNILKPQAQFSAGSFKFRNSMFH